MNSYVHSIPEVDHESYNELIANDTIEKDVNGYNGDFDFQMEVTAIKYGRILNVIRHLYNYLIIIYPFY